MTNHLRVKRKWIELYLFYGASVRFLGAEICFVEFGEAEFNACIIEQIKFDECLQVL